MTNKVKPFYIRITDDITPQMVQDAFDKCVALGAKESEKVNDDWFKRIPYFGVCAEDGTYFGIDGGAYVGAQEITLDQFDEWLRFEVEDEWKSGDRVTIENPEGFGTWDEAEKYIGTNGTVMAVFTNTNGKKVAAVSHDDNVCICWMLSMLSKPETPEQKVERERLEAAYDLYCYAKKESVYSCVIVSFKEFIGDFFAREREEYLAIVDKTNYRKQ